MNIHEFTWSSSRDEPARQLAPWASRQIDLITASVTAYSQDSIGSWKVYATGNIGGWMIYANTNKLRHQALPDSAIIPAIMLEADGIRGSLFTSEREYNHISTPGFIDGAEGMFLPVLPPVDGALGRGWLNASDLHLPLAVWMGETKEPRTGQIWLAHLVANELLSIFDVGEPLSQELLRTIEKWPSNEHVLSQWDLWRKFIHELRLTLLWKRATRTKRMEILTAVGNSLTQSFPGWDQFESWNHIRKVNHERRTHFK